MSRNRYVCSLSGEHQIKAAEQKKSGLGRLAANEIRLSEWGKKRYKRRGETVERSFADAKQHHGHRYCRYRGIKNVSAQCLLAAACQNMKKMALMKAA